MTHTGLYRDLAEVKRIIIEEGWTTGRLHRSEGYCLDGAILKAAGYNPPCYDGFSLDNPKGEETESLYAVMGSREDTRLDAILVAVASELPKLTSHSDEPAHMTIYGWQDVHGRTMEEVLAILDQVMMKCK